MPAPEVGVLTVQPGDVGLQTELPGRREASRVAQVRARATGILQQRLFQEGSDVKAGQVLFRIDAAPYEAALQSAQAQLARAEANLSQARALAGRLGDLPGGDALDAVASKARLGLVQQALARGQRGGSRVSPRAGSGRWWG